MVAGRRWEPKGSLEIIEKVLKEEGISGKNQNGLFAVETFESIIQFLSC